jgi:hypothetical protein
VSVAVRLEVPDAVCNLVCPFRLPVLRPARTGVDVRDREQEGIE